MKRKWAVPALAVISALAIGPSTVAMADDGSAATDEAVTFSVSAPMNIVGYDSEVAEAHGYRIVTDANGVQSSVPVTRAAVAEREREVAAAESLILPFDTKRGTCGTSSLTGRKGSHDTVTFTTSFSIIGNVAEYDWAVDANGFVTSNWWSTSGTGPTPGSQKTWTGAIPGVIGWGKAKVPNNSARASVIKTDGGVCYSGGPEFQFD